jgi:acyl-coenzyme A synthetase/AMP-(fatty) acid ligase
VKGWGFGAKFWQLQYLLADGQVQMLLTCQHLHPRLPAHPLTLTLDDTDVQEAIRSAPSTPPITTATLDSLAYLIYTSGSTGHPKGVLVEHRWLPHLAHEQMALFGVQPRDRLSHLLAPSFDASLSEILTCWLAGATLYPAPAEALRPGPKMVAFLEEHQITLAHFTSSVLAALPAAPLSALRTLVIGGESCPAELAMSHVRQGRAVYPVYGLTEATVCNFGARYAGDGSQPSLGHAYSYVQAEVWDEQGHPVEPGTPGQIVLAGPLARGYTDPLLTAERFVWRAGVRWCLTGDYGAHQADGTYRFLGRQDSQHKVSGYLLDLSQVEATLRAHPAVRDAKAFLLGGRWVVAYVVLSAPLRVHELHMYLTPRLPEHALPACCVVLEALPLTGSGKVSTRLDDYPEPRAADYRQFVTIQVGLRKSVE